MNEIIWKELEKVNFKVSTDSRKDISRTVFFALKGENFDGNLFVKNARKNGARACVTDDPKNKGKNIFVVDDVLKTLQELANRYRKTFNIPIIAIGGSNGKTTSKELTKIVLETKYKVFTTPGSLNNHFGVPLSIFLMQKDTEIAVFEIGANHPKEHTDLLSILEPTHVVVTNNGMDHLEGFLTPEGSRRGNSEIYEFASSRDLTAFVNKKHPDLMSDSKKVKRSLYPGVALKIADESPLSVLYKNKKYKTQLVGNYNLENIYLAITVGKYFDISEEKSLNAICNFVPEGKRSQFVRKNNTSFVVDCYNANPTSMELSLKSFLGSTRGLRGVVLGDMLELGKYTEREHAKVLSYLQKQKLDCVILIGENFIKAGKNADKNKKYHYFKTSDEARDFFGAHDFRNYTFLLKGSRGIQVEKILEDRKKPLRDLLQNVVVIKTIGSLERNISSVCFDSRKVTDSSIFVAIKGTDTDGTTFIKNAIKKGAKTIVCENTVSIDRREDVTYIIVKNSRSALSLIAQNFYDNPSTKLKLIGVTGTNGKTTTATMLFELFRALGYSAALLSTIENKINFETFKATHTTPDPVSLAEFLFRAVQRGCTYAFMECSSHAIDQKRTEGLAFAEAIFTNLTQDHLDYHKTIKAYAKVKKELFLGLSKDAFALANIDDAFGTYMLEGTKAKKYFFSVKSASDFQAKILSQSLDGLKISIGKQIIRTKTIGNFNAYNIAGIFAAATLLGIPENKIVRALRNLPPPEGRLQFAKSKSGVFGVVDYAHTPDALENVLKTLREIKKKSARIITVVGCGGDRDKTKRGGMGKISCELSDYSIFTSDNSRSEKTEDILNNITTDLTNENFECIPDRKKAIKKASRMAQSGDVVLVAGKGHEKYQILGEKTVYFSDMDELSKNFK